MSTVKAQSVDWSAVHNQKRDNSITFDFYVSFLFIHFIEFLLLTAYLLCLKFFYYKLRNYTLFYSWLFRMWTFISVIVLFWTTYFYFCFHIKLNLVVCIKKQQKNYVWANWCTTHSFLLSFIIQLQHHKTQLPIISMRLSDILIHCKFFFIRKEIFCFNLRTFLKTKIMQ